MKAKYFKPKLAYLESQYNHNILQTFVRTFLSKTQLSQNSSSNKNVHTEYWVRYVHIQHQALYY